MLGSRSDAEDVVQDAYLRFAGAEDVRNTEAMLVTIVTRLCLDRLKSARAQREVYVGPWLPEPVIDAEQLSADTATELADDLSFALLLALDRLSPPERAAFLLHDVFDTPFPDVARMLERSEAACRQLASRARRAVRDQRATSPTVAPEAHARLLAAFSHAAASGDLSALAGPSERRCSPLHRWRRPQVRGAQPDHQRGEDPALLCGKSPARMPAARFASCR
jgi:RNA polymerase sigma-70 factor (ECF subfamily)